MAELLLGRFPEFKGAETVLLSCTRFGVGNLVAYLQPALFRPVGVHEIAEVSQSRPTGLFVAAAPIKGAPTLVVDQLELARVSEKLRVLAHADAGHQYFDLVGAPATLLVSLNEYDEEWWRTHA